jgi:broad specificity phosphatase PhoE
MIRSLILIRHGETIDNARGVAQGWRDSLLSDRGQRQIELLAERIARLQPDAIFTSPLPRALTTAVAVARSIGLEPSPLQELMEMNCGDWEGLSFSALREADPDFHERWMSDPYTACPSGESYEDVRQRMRRAFDAINDLHREAPEVKVVIVSHGTAIRVAATELLGLPLSAARSFAQDNTAINTFERRGDRYVLKLWNDATHCEAIR